MKTVVEVVIIIIIIIVSNCCCYRSIKTIKMFATVEQCGMAIGWHLKELKNHILAAILMYTTKFSVSISVFVSFA